jgi:phosphatidyl-myo-inositol alpha-mannosyltransferase
LRAGRPTTLAAVRVGLVCPYSLTIPGGVQGQVLGLARALRGLGHEVRVLGPCDGPPPDAGVTPLGNSIPLAANGSVAPIAPDLPCALRTIRALRDEDFDVVHAHEPFVPGPCMVTTLMKTAPLVGTFHAAGVSASYRWFNPALRAALGRLDVRCVVSADARQLVQKALGGDYELLFNGIEVERFAKATPTPTDGPTILFVGRHEERKGLRVLLQAMEQLPPDTHLWVASDGPQTAELKEYARGDHRIEWLGRVDDDERNRRLRGADVFCAPSLGGESFGVVLLEAMAAGTAIVASDLPGYANVARADREAALVPPGDVDALAGALRRALSEPSWTRALAEGGRARAEELSMDNLALRYVDLYERARHRS